jgi:hypothetical protein
MRKSIKVFLIIIGLYSFVGVSVFMLLSTSSMLARDPDEFKTQSLMDDDSYLPQEITHETYRFQPKNKLAIVGYDQQGDMPTRTLVMIDGEPVFLKRVLTEEDASDEFDFVRMSDERLFLCLHDRNDKCWRADSLSETPGN